MFFSFGRVDVLKSTLMWVAGSLCVGPHPWWRRYKQACGSGELWDEMRGSLGFQVMGTRVSSGLPWEKGPAGAFCGVAGAGSQVGWVCARCICEMRENSTSANRGQDNIQDPTPALWKTDCFLCFSLGLTFTPQRGHPGPSYLAATLPSVSLTIVFNVIPRTCLRLEYRLSKCRGLTDSVHCCVFNTYNTLGTH